MGFFCLVFFVCLFFILVKVKGPSSLIVSFIKRIGRVPKVSDMSGTLKKTSIKIYFDVVNMSR